MTEVSSSTTPSALSIWVQKHEEPLKWAALAAVVAAIALCVGFCVSIGPTYQAGLVLDSPLHDLAKTFLFIGVCGGCALSFLFLPIVIVGVATPSILEKKTTIMRRVILTVGVLIALLGIGLIIGSSMLKNSGAFADIKNSFRDQASWEAAGRGYAGRIVAGSTALVIGAAVFALGVFSTFPEKLAQKWEARQQRLSEEAARNAEENPTL